MVRLVLSALRERRPQTLSLFVLTILAALGGCAAPWFSNWAHEAVASADIASAPLAQRLVIVSGAVRYNPGDPSPAEHGRQLVASSLPIPGGDVVVATNLFTQALKVQPQAVAPTTVTIGYRDNVCAHLIITGTCPDGSGQVLLGRRVAATLNVKPGDAVSFSALELTRPMTLTVSGLYDVADALSPYWAGASSSTLAPRPLDQSAYTTEQTLLAAQPDRVDLQYQLLLPAAAFHDSGTPLTAALASAAAKVRPTLTVKTTADVLIAQLRQDQSLVSAGVQLASIQLVLLCWFALYLAVRYTSDTRRPDIGLLRLRGTAGWRVWSLIALQSAVPMLAGAMVGLGLGVVASAALAGSLVTPHHQNSLLTSLAVAAGIGVGALVVCLAAEARALRSPVATLMRRVPARGSGWRAEIGDVLVLVVAIAAVYQGYAEVSAGGEPSFLALLAPGLVGLAVAVLAARGLPWLARRGGTLALGGGRAGIALTALHVARRPGTQRVFAVVAVAVSVLTTTLFFWQTATDSWSRRSVAELGAARVLTVRAPSSADLLTLVRAADPAGRYAMAVARGAGGAAAEQVLAVDTSRLAAVADLPPELGLPDAATLARLLHPALATPPVLADGPVSLAAGGPETGLPVTVAMAVVDPAGGWHQVVFGPLTPGRGSYDATVSGCPAGCRLVAFEPVTDRPEVTVDLFGLTQGSRTVVSGQQFGDIARWRPPIGVNVLGTTLATAADRLTLSLYSGPLTGPVHLDRRVYLADSPTPVPVAVVGTLIDSAGRSGDARLTVLGADAVSYAVVAGGSILPRLGTVGALMDLEYAEFSASGPSESVGLEVWLTADAPPSVVDYLRDHGVQILDDDSLGATTDRLRSQGPGVALRFELFAAGVLLLVAAGTVMVSSTVERRARAEELAALRAQGLPERTVRRVAYGGLGVLVGAAIAIGLVAALVAEWVNATSLPVFADAWNLLPVREGPWAGPAGVALVASLVVLGGAAVLGARRTVQAVRARRGGER